LRIGDSRPTKVSYLKCLAAFKCATSIDPNQLVNVPSEGGYVKLRHGVALFGMSDCKENMKAFVDNREPKFSRLAWRNSLQASSSPTPFTLS
jgi:hypothetical protein